MLTLNFIFIQAMYVYHCRNQILIVLKDPYRKMAYVRVHKKQRLKHISKCKWFHWEVIPGSTGREVKYEKGGSQLREH